MLTGTSLLTGLSDADAGDSAFIASVNQPGNGTVTFQPTGSFTYQHDDSETTTDQFSYVVEDDSGNQNTVFVDVTITPVNDNPPFLPKGILIVSKGNSTTVLQSGSNNLLNGVIDPDPDDSATVVTNTNPANGTAAIQTDGSFSYQHDGSETIEDQFFYTIEDTVGNSHTVEIEVIVTPANLHTPFVPNDTLIVNEGGMTDTFASGRTNLLQDLIDADSTDTASVDIVTLPANGTITQNTDGTFQYIHSDTETLSDIFEYRVTDSGGNAHIVEIPVSIVAINDAPDGIASAIELQEDAVYTFSVTDFPYIDTTEQHALLSVQISELPSQGNLTLNSNPVNADEIISVAEINNGSLTYKPDENVFGIFADALKFQVIDSGGTANGGSNIDGTPETLTITIVPLNDSPMLTTTIDDLVISENSTIQHSIPATLFEDVDNDSLTTTLAMTDGGTLPDWLSYQIAPDGTITLTAAPEIGDIGTVNLRVQATDSQGLSSPAAFFNIIVTDVNNPPTNIQHAQTSIDENLTGGNITPITVTDPDTWDSSTISIDDSRFEVVDGMLKLVDEVSLDHEQEPQVLLQLTATDTGDNEYVDSLTVTVNDVNEAPYVTGNSNGGTNSLPVLAPFTVQLPLDLFLDPDGDVLHVTATLADGAELPDWVTFDNVLMQLTIADGAPAGELRPIRLTATDADGETAFDDVALIIEAMPEPVPALAYEAQIDNSQTPIEPATAAIIHATDSTNSIVKNETDNPTSFTIPDNDTNATRITDTDIIESITIAQPFESDLQNSLKVIPDEVKKHNPLSTPVIELPLVQPQKIQSINNILDLVLASRLDLQRDELAKQQDHLDDLIQSSTTISSALSIGYIIWLVRGGLLIGSLMASLPVWRTIDPLPVLNEFNDDDNDDDESLEALVATDNKDVKDANKKVRSCATLRSDKESEGLT